MNEEILNDRCEDSRDMSLLARDQYEREVSWFEADPLSPEEEKKYLDRILRARREPSNGWLKTLAKDARERLIQHYQPLVRRVVLGYARPFRGMDFLDLVQEANLTLLQVFDTFSSECLEEPFRAWVFGCVRVSLRRLYWNENGFVRLNYSIQEGIANINAVSRRYRLEFGRFPSASELSNALGLSRSRIYELLHYRCLADVGSIEAVCESSEIAEDCQDFVSLYQQFSEGERARSDALAARVDQVIVQLPPMRRKFISLYYGLCGEAPHTVKEICTLLNVKKGNADATISFTRKKLQVMLAPLYESQEVAV